jgi:hypothetical protein
MSNRLLLPKLEETRVTQLTNNTTYDRSIINYNYNNKQLLQIIYN